MIGLKLAKDKDEMGLKLARNKNKIGLKFFKFVENKDEMV